MRKKIKLFFLLIICVFLLVIMVLAIQKMIVWAVDAYRSRKIIQDINDITFVEEINDTELTNFINPPNDKDNDYWYYVKFPLIDVNFYELKKKNKDTAGWIHVNNTNINYPYVQTKDNDYYLDHSFNRRYNKAGWVFLDYRNSPDLNDKNSILYAHNRSDKTLFGSLAKALKSDWYQDKDNHIIRLSTPTENTLWQIFSVYKIEKESYYITTHFNSDEEYLTFLNTMKKRSIYDFDTTLNINDQILTLSTCYTDNTRTVVQAKLIKKEA